MEYLVMRHMGWTWQELQDAPADIVAEVWRYMQTELKHQQWREGK